MPLIPTAKDFSQLLWTASSIASGLKIGTLFPNNKFPEVKSILGVFAL